MIVNVVAAFNTRLEGGNGVHYHTGSPPHTCTYGHVVESCAVVLFLGIALAKVEGLGGVHKQRYNSCVDCVVVLGASTRCRAAYISCAFPTEPPPVLMPVHVSSFCCGCRCRCCCPQVAFKGIGAMPGSMVQAMRSAAVAAVDAHLAEQTARLELILCRTH